MPDPIRAIIFDFDGVIVDSEPAHARSMAHALAHMGLDVPPDLDANWHQFIGRGDRECLVDLATQQRRALSPDELDRAVAVKAQAFQRPDCQALIRPFQHTILLLRQAAATLPVAVCSGSVRDTVHRGLERLGLRPLLRAVITADDVPRNKPHPDPYLAAANALALPPSHTLAIEDSPTGIAAARAAGCHVLAVAHSFPPDRLADAHRVSPSTAHLTLADLLNHSH